MKPIPIRTYTHGQSRHGETKKSQVVVEIYTIFMLGVSLFLRYGAINTYLPTYLDR